MLYRCVVCGKTADHPSPDRAVAMVTCGSDDDVMVPDTDDESLVSIYWRNVQAICRGTYYIHNSETYAVPDRRTG